MANYHHVPVMLREVLDYLNIKEGGCYVDGTLGGGSYTRAIAEKAKLVLSIDLDPLAIDNFSKNKLKNVLLVNDNFSNLNNIVLEKKINDKFDGIVVDLGLSSAQLDDDERGFSFNKDKSLDMSFGNNFGDTYQIVNGYSQDSLTEIIKEYGQEPWAKKIAENITSVRRKNKISTAQQLAEIVSYSIPRKFWPRRIHPATKTFQAFRMETNKELDNLKDFLPTAVSLLKKGGRLVIVSFHSLEDRIAKILFKGLSRQENPSVKILTAKPIKPQEDEILENQRSRSAKLRAVEKI